MLFFVFPGGGGCGSVQTGMAVSVMRRGWIPQGIVGTSVGGLDGMGLKFKGPDGLLEIWDSIGDRSDVFGSTLFGWSPTEEGFYSTKPLEKLIERATEGKPKYDFPVYTTATDLNEGKVVYTSSETLKYSAPIVDPDSRISIQVNESLDHVRKMTLASASIPLVVPPIDGRFVDGGVLENAPLKKAIELGATDIFVFMCHPLGILPRMGEFKTPKKLAIAMRTLDIMMNDSLKWDLHVCQEKNSDPKMKQINVQIIEPPSDYQRTSFDFSREAIQHGLYAGLTKGLQWEPSRST